MRIESNNLREYTFGSFCLRPGERLLLHEGRPVKLPPKAFSTLLVLVQRSGSLVEKSELIQIIWPDTAVEEGNLNLVVSQIRKALMDRASEPQYIETIPKHGYRFIADVAVSESCGAQENSPPIQHSVDTESTLDETQQQTSEGVQTQSSIKKRSQPIIWISILAVAALISQYFLLGIITRQAAEFVRSDHPQIDKIVSVSPPIAGRQFYMQIQGRGIDPRSVRVVVTGRGCQDFGKCVVPNDVLHWYGNVTDSQLERVPLTLASGDYQIFVQNGSAGGASNALQLTVKMEE
jgi:DNA-binding winged helix-turn-helix (wHTH) protein